LKWFNWQHALVLAVTIGCIVYIAPTFKPGIWPHKKINLGLDLQGGMHLILEVKTGKSGGEHPGADSQRIADVFP